MINNDKTAALRRAEARAVKELRAEQIGEVIRGLPEQMRTIAGGFNATHDDLVRLKSMIDTLTSVYSNYAMSEKKFWVNDFHQFFAEIGATPNDVEDKARYDALKNSVFNLANPFKVMSTSRETCERIAESEANWKMKLAKMKNLSANTGSSEGELSAAAVLTAKCDRLLAELASRREEMKNIYLKAKESITKFLNNEDRKMKGVQ